VRVCVHVAGARCSGPAACWLHRRPGRPGAGALHGVGAERAACPCAQVHPVRLWDAVTGGVRGSYRAYDAVDEVVAATSVAFSACGSRLLAGFNKCLRVWDVARPGRECREVVTHRRRQDGLPGARCGWPRALAGRESAAPPATAFQERAARRAAPGIVSCLAPSPDRSGLLAAGSYSGAAALFDEGAGELLFVLAGHVGGVTQARARRPPNSGDSSVPLRSARAAPARAATTGQAGSALHLCRRQAWRPAGGGMAAGGAL